MSEDDAILAGELALGLLDGAERAAAMRRVVAEPGFAREVDRWRQRFATLHGSGRDVEPSADFGRRVLELPDLKPGEDRRWRWLAAAASLVAASLLIALLLRPAAVAPPPPATTLLIAVIKPEQGKPFGALYDGAAREVRLSGSVPVPAGMDAELWAIGSDGKPRAAGLIRQDGTVRVRVATNLAIGAGLTLAISVEPAGGSPGPAPTGPVVATGELVAI